MASKKITRIKIEDIQKDKKISKEEMKKLSGGPWKYFAYMWWPEW